MTSPKLLPCPFCSRVPVASGHASEHTASGQVFFVACYCGGYSACAHKMGDTEQEAADAWNTRAAVGGVGEDKEVRR